MVPAAEDKGMVCRLSQVLGLMLALAALPGIACAMQQRYEVPLIHARWTVEKAPLACSLEHRIPRFGVARFHQSVDEPLAFVIDGEHPLPADSEVLVELVPVKWQHARVPEELGRFATGEAHALQLDGDYARTLLVGLESGMVPSVSWGSSAPQRQVQVTMNVLFFREALRDFDACVAQLPSAGFDTLRHSEFFYGPNERVLGQAARERLSRIAFYLKHNPEVDHVEILGYADDRGSKRYNRALSRERALMVKRFLEKQGIPARRLRIKAMGEVKKAGQRARRVEITLYRK